MRVLWLCNVMLPAYAKEHGLSFTNREGWLSGCYEKIEKEIEISKEDRDGSALGICFPSNNDEFNLIMNSDRHKNIVKAPSFYKEKIRGISFFGFYGEDLNLPENYVPELESSFDQIIREFKPDIVHIFGTEFPHSLAMLRAVNKINSENEKSGLKIKTLLGIQGLCSEIEKCYMAGLPKEVQKAESIRDKLKNDSLQNQLTKYKSRAEHELEAISLTDHITGRTKFDHDVTEKINPKAVYHAMNETMRSCFYDEKSIWDLNEARAHTIFMSQGDYPLKGFHFMIEAMDILVKRYPDARLYVGGNSIIGKPDRRTVEIKDDESSQKAGKSKYPLFIRISEYGLYLRKLISKYHLKKNVTVLGKLSAEQMKEQFLKCSVYVCPSVLENSPNSVGEAMLLGVPVAASRTGGIPDMIEDRKSGVLFEPENAGAIAETISEMWDESVITSVYGENARKRALITHDPKINYERLIEIYRAISAN